MRVPDIVDEIHDSLGGDALVPESLLSDWEIRLLDAANEEAGRRIFLECRFVYPSHRNVPREIFTVGGETGSESLTFGKPDLKRHCAVPLFLTAVGWTTWPFAGWWMRMPVERRADFIVACEGS